MSKYFVTKTFNPNKGFSCVFRQHKANTHCNLLHGYDLIFQVTFECAPEDLSKEGWVVDFGDLDVLKKRIEKHFDHTLIVAEDDPDKERILDLKYAGVANVIEFPRVGCEAFSAWLAVEAYDCITLNGDLERGVTVRSAVVYEHGANAAGFQPNGV